MGAKESAPAHFGWLYSPSSAADMKQPFDPFYMSEWVFVRVDYPNVTAPTAAATTTASATPKRWTTAELAGTNVQFTELQWDTYRDRMPRTKAVAPGLRVWQRAPQPANTTAGTTGTGSSTPSPMEQVSGAYELTALKGVTGTLTFRIPSKPLTAAVDERGTAPDATAKAAATATVPDTPVQRLLLALCTADGGATAHTTGAAPPSDGVVDFRWTRGKTANTITLTHRGTGAVFVLSSEAPAGAQPAL